MAISSQEWQADTIQPTGSSGMKGSFQNTHGIVQPGSNYEAAEWVSICQTASMQIIQLTSDNATLESNCSSSRADNFYLQPSVLLQVTSYLWYTHIYCFDESGIQPGTGKCCKPLGHLKEYVNELRTIFLHVNFC